MTEEYTIKKISNGYIVTWYINDTWEERYFEDKSDVFDFINQVME